MNEDEHWQLSEEEFILTNGGNDERRNKYELDITAS